MLKTKKKKKKKKVVVEEDDANEVSKGPKTAWEGTDRDYSYAEMLERAFVLMQERNPGLATKYISSLLLPLARLFIFCLMLFKLAEKDMLCLLLKWCEWEQERRCGRIFL